MAQTRKIQPKCLIESKTMTVLFAVLLLIYPLIGSTETLNWVGCGISKKAYMQELAVAYEQKTGIKIEIEGGGATKGIRDVSSSAADIGGSCRNKLYNNPAEENATLIPVAWDALAVIAHKDNPVRNLTLAQLRDIYLGRITYWRELGGKDQPIELYVREGKISGVGRSIRKYIFHNYDQDFGPATLFKSSGPLEKAVELAPNGIGITGISSARKRDVAILSLEGREPSYENIRGGKYLLYRPLYLVYNENGKNKDLVRDFIKFAHGKEGQKVMRQNGTVPYLAAPHLITFTVGDRALGK